MVFPDIARVDNRLGEISRRFIRVQSGSVVLIIYGKFVLVEFVLWLVYVELVRAELEKIIVWEGLSFTCE